MKVIIQAKSPSDIQDLIAKGYSAIDLQGTFVKETNIPKEILDHQNWRKFNTKEGQWTFLNDREGKRMEEFSKGELALIVERLIAGNKAIMGDYVYTASKDGKFLHRVLVSKK